MSAASLLADALDGQTGFDPGAKCDALSAAVSFTADPATVGSSVFPDDAGNECFPTADGTRPITDASTVSYACP